MATLNKLIVYGQITNAIRNRKVLRIRYRHVEDNEIVEHIVAPFDIGTTNPDYYERNKDNVYAYSFTHINKKTNNPDPKVCAFNIESFLEITETGEDFSPSSLAVANKAATGYDYRTCKFAVERSDYWFSEGG